MKRAHSHKNSRVYYEMLTLIIVGISDYLYTKVDYPRHKSERTYSLIGSKGMIKVGCYSRCLSVGQVMLLLLLLLFLWVLRRPCRIWGGSQSGVGICTWVVGIGVGRCHSQRIATCVIVCTTGGWIGCCAARVGVGWTHHCQLTVAQLTWKKRYFNEASRKTVLERLLLNVSTHAFMSICAT